MLTDQDLQILDNFLSGNAPIRTAIAHYCEVMQAKANSDCAAAMRAANAHEGHKFAIRAELFGEFLSLMEARLQSISSGPTA